MMTASATMIGAATTMDAASFGRTIARRDTGLVASSPSVLSSTSLPNVEVASTIIVIGSTMPRTNTWNAGPMIASLSPLSPALTLALFISAASPIGSSASTSNRASRRELAA